MVKVVKLLVVYLEPEALLVNTMPELYGDESIDNGHWHIPRCRCF